MQRTWARWLVVVAGGLAMALVFPPFDAPWPLLPLGVAAWWLATAGDRPALALVRTLLFGLAFYLLLLRWMLVVGSDAWVALALLEAAFLAPVGLIRARVPRWPLGILLVPGVWVLTDVIRDHAGMLAFGWGQLAFASIDAPWAGLLPITSQWVVTAVIVAIGILIGELGLGSRRRPVLLALGVLLTGPFIVPAQADVPLDGPRLALVQGGVAHTGLGFLGDPLDVLQRLARVTEEQVAPNSVDLVVWPENASDVDPGRNATARDRILAVSDAVQTPVLLGAVLERPDGRRNASVLASDGSLDVRYEKQRLVPFGEYLPMRDLLTRFTDRVRFLPIDFRSGDGAGSITVGEQRVGIVICFEVADEGVVRAALANGEVALIVQTNNATYAGLGQAEQQLRIAQVRARAFGVPVYVVSTNGPTAVLDRDGRIREGIDEGQRGIIEVVMPGT